VEKSSAGIETILAAAVEIMDPVERQWFLDGACLGDRALRAEVEQMVKQHFEAGSFLESPVASPDKGTWERIDPLIREHVGTLIGGRYKLLEEIGEGGMGTVWVAEQTQPVRRKVALKLIKAGMDSKSVLARFEAERQALALMDHPNIAKVLDGGTVSGVRGQESGVSKESGGSILTPDPCLLTPGFGRPFFVMEFVKGVPFTKYCDDACLSVEERLTLFLPVCHAVQHAHQKGIIHRDLKPSNILVCHYDGVPIPKVIDFGLAKAIYQPLTEHTLHTAQGLMMGTPLYMSPEQAELNNLDVDTRTDIYALGVILYELLTGTTPLERKRLKEAAWHEMLRLIKEEEPPKPSTRLSGSGTLPSVAAQRKLEPAKLTKLVRGDLDWIVMKALDKERGRRYETANGLARDLQNYLADEPVEATPPSRGYRLRKFARKHKKALDYRGVRGPVDRGRGAEHVAGGLGHGGRG
jgi:serine/threonine protein kinase